MNNHLAKKKRMGITASFLIIITIILLIILLFYKLQGATTSSGSFYENESMPSLVCENHNHYYPYFTKNGTVDNFTRINIIFNSNNISTISLHHTITFENSELAQSSEPVNHAAMNKSFGNKLGADSLNARYTINDNSMTMTLYANTKDFNEQTKKYFLINEEQNDIQKYKDYYEKIGFKCKEQSKEAK